MTIYKPPIFSEMSANSAEKRLKTRLQAREASGWKTGTSRYQQDLNTVVEMPYLVEKVG
jgi:hypothetical protein